VRATMSVPVSLGCVLFWARWKTLEDESVRGCGICRGVRLAAPVFHRGEPVRLDVVGDIELFARAVEATVSASRHQTAKSSAR